MINKIIIGLLIICALGLSGTAAYYSIIGLTKIFVGIVIPVTIMAIFIESSKVLIATVLHQYWTKLSKWLRGGLITSLIISMSITSIGIYGLLNSGYNQTSIKLETIDNQTNFYNNKIETYQVQLSDFQQENKLLSENIIQLNNGLSNNKTQYTDKNGNVVISQSNSNRKTLENQLNKTQQRRDVLSSKIDALNDSISNYNQLKLQLNSDSDLAAEVGPLKYLSKLTNTSMDVVINWFSIAIMLVFDPLAIMLILTISSLTKPSLDNNIPLSPPHKSIPFEQPTNFNKDLLDIPKFLIYLGNINESVKYKTERGYKIPLLVLSDLGYEKPILYKIIQNTPPNNGRMIIEDIYCTIEHQNG